MKKTQIVADGETSDLWRALQVETICFDGRWIRRTDYWPFGITVRPGTDPVITRNEVIRTLSTAGVSFEPGEIRLWDPHT